MDRAELIEVLNIYFEPIFQILGGVLAVLIVGVAAVFILRPFLKRL